MKQILLFWQIQSDKGLSIVFLLLKQQQYINIVTGVLFSKSLRSTMKTLDFFLIRSDFQGKRN